MVCLPPGVYSVEGLVRTTGVIGGYATLRISGDTMSLRLTGENSWRLLQHQFFLEDGGDAELVCELNSPSGEAWFELESLRVRKSTSPIPARFPALPVFRP